MTALKLELTHSDIYWLVNGIRLLKQRRGLSGCKKDIRAFIIKLEQEIKAQTGYVFEV